MGPIYNLLEDEFTVWVVNTHHIKAVPGRETDVKDAEWTASNKYWKGPTSSRLPWPAMYWRVSGRTMLAPLAEGEAESSGVLANLAKGQLGEKQGELAEDLRGVVGPHQKLMLSTHLRHLEYLDQEVAQRFSFFE